MSLKKLSRSVLVSTGVPRLRVLAMVQAAAIRETGCDVSQKLPIGPHFVMSHSVTPPRTLTRKRKTIEITIVYKI